MKKSLELAYLGRYGTHPNPMVGCVIVKNNHMIGHGYHQKR
ncbi:MAG: riboflavin biosynthesis protein RibD, partial [Gammaproteobacteria bacterium]|nr:riboflavin biosynthesis protein RibD [Gammaproteobacteria bacterium]